MLRLLAFISAIVVMFFSTNVYCEKWYHDYDKALEIAEKQNKGLFIVFETDTCPHCIYLERNVLSKEEFTRTVEEHLIPLKLHYKTDDSQPDEVIQQYTDLKAQYKIRGVPTIVITDARENTLGTFGRSTMRTGPKTTRDLTLKEYIKMVKTIVQKGGFNSARENQTSNSSTLSPDALIDIYRPEFKRKRRIGKSEDLSSLKNQLPSDLD